MIPWNPSGTADARRQARQAMRSAAAAMSRKPLAIRRDDILGRGLLEAMVAGADTAGTRADRRPRASRFRNRGRTGGSNISNVGRTLGRGANRRWTAAAVLVALVASGLQARWTPIWRHAVRIARKH